MGKREPMARSRLTRREEGQKLAGGRQVKRESGHLKSGTSQLGAPRGSLFRSEAVLGGRKRRSRLKASMPDIRGLSPRFIFRPSDADNVESPRDSPQLLTHRSSAFGNQPEPRLGFRERQACCLVVRRGICNSLTASTRLGVGEAHAASRTRRQSIVLPEQSRVEIDCRAASRELSK